MSDSKLAIVTGGTSGLGLATVELLLECGYQVAFTGHQAEHIAQVQAKIGQAENCLAIEADVAREADVVRTFEVAANHFGAIPCAVANCAGLALIAKVADTSLEQWNHIFAVQATGTFLMCREAVRLWAKHSLPGAIVNVSSVSARTGAPMASAYAASKAAVLGFTRSLAKEVASSGIRVNALCPGAMDTKMFNEDTLGPFSTMFKRDKEALLKGTLSTIPMRRLLSPGEVAQSVVYLLSAQASGITGQSLNVDGGLDTH